MNPTLKTTLAKTLIILSLALAAFFAYPSRGWLRLEQPGILR